MAESTPAVSTDLLIVGAGPTGLTLAIQARLMGADVRIVERRQQPRPWAPALAVQPRTMEVLRGLGVAEAVLARGVTQPALHLHVGGAVIKGRLYDLPLPETEYPLVSFVAQPEVEDVLRRRAAELGAEVEWGTELVELAQTGDGISARVRGPGGDETIVGRYLAGCDGSDSTVRQRLGIRFRGRRYRETIVVADARAATDLDQETAHGFLTRDGIVFLFPLAEGRWRVIAPQPPGVADDPDLVEIVSRHTAGELRLDSVEWQRAIRPQHRIAARFRQGDAFLVGDAAHVHSPAGAQGMNTGIQDAVNLGWKIGLALRGAPDALLDTYQSERRPVAMHVVALTGLAFALEVSDMPWLRLARRLAAPHIAALLLPHPRLIAMVARVVSGLDTRYRRGAIGRGGTACGGEGRRLPDQRLAPGPRRLHRLLDASRFHLLVYDRSIGSERLELRDRSAVLQIHRIDSPLRRGGMPGRLEPSFELVRPDGYVAVSGRGPGLAGVADYLSRWVGVARGPSSPAHLEAPGLAGGRGAHTG